MAKKTHIKVRLVPEAKPDSSFFYYVKKPAGGEKAKVKLSAKKYNPDTKKHEIFVEKKSEIVDNKRIKIILRNIKNKSLRNNIDPKITNRIWKNMISAYIDFEKRNFKKK